ncbi:MAG: hypothetical protein QHG98_05140 [Methanothrix sp.]|nr:hypothetical protein [Methanothrix sp.]
MLKIEDMPVLRRIDNLAEDAELVDFGLPELASPTIQPHGSISEMCGM